MHDKQFPLTQVLYTDYLAKVAGKNLSKREVDVLACILSGRPAKGIGRFLSISDRTVESHTYNIMTVLGCSSREALISFVERSDKFLILREYYVTLLAEIAFENILKKIAPLINNPNKKCFIIYSKEGAIGCFAKQLKKHLKLIGIEASLEEREKAEWMDVTSPSINIDNCQLYVVSEKFDHQDLSPLSKLSQEIEKKAAPNTFFLLLEKKDPSEFSQELFKGKSIDFTLPANYYFSIFELFKNFFPDINIDDFIKEFKEQYKPSNNILSTASLTKTTKIKNEPLFQAFIENFITNRKWHVLGAFITTLTTLSICGIIYFTGKEKQIISLTPNLVESPIRSDLPIPSDVTLLNHSELINQLDKKLQENKGIQTVALVGIGGAGKTTLARQYAHEQKANVIWELNAETSGSLHASFVKLAHALSKTENDRKLLRGLLEIKNATEKKEQLISFVKGYLKLLSPWFLVFDNVENL